MKRTAFLRKAPDTATASVAVKQARCRATGCGARFTQFRSFETWCSPECGATIAAKRLKKASAVKERAEKIAYRTQREAQKTAPDLKREAQQAFNAFIRFRDAGLSCICCGKMPKGESLTGGSFDAGHYRSVGSAPHLRYDERNCHAQLKQCNQYGGGRAVDYRIGLIARIGLESVEALEADQTAKHYSRDDLREIRDRYRRTLRELKKAAA